MTAFVGNIYFERGDGGSPESFDRVCSVMSLSGLGETNDLVDVTTFCSTGNREYISGLADGQEITVEANYETDSAELASMIADVKAKTNKNYRVVVESGSPTQVLSFAGTPLSWVLNPSVDDKNTISFTIKISGEIEITP